MLVLTLFISSLLSTTTLSIAEPIDGEEYDGNWLPLRAIVENENESPDSVHYCLNGSGVIQIPRLNTDWPTYMQSYLHHGYSESPAPMDNSILWSAPVTGYFHEFPTPIVYEGMVFYTSDSIGMATTDTLFALDAATGAVLWVYDTGHADDAVTVVDGFLYTAADSIFCFNAYTGEKIWSSGEADGGGSTPVVSNSRVFCGNNAGGGSDSSNVTCLNALTGAVIWSEPLIGSQVSCMSIWNERLYVPTIGNNPTAPLYALNPGDGSVLWQNDDAEDGYWDSSPVVVDSVIYICAFDGSIRAIDAIAGETIWVESITPGPISAITATPAYHDERLYFADQVDSYHCLEALTGTSVWEITGTTQHGSSGIADGVVFYGECTPISGTDFSRVVARDCDTGAEIWSYATIGKYGFQSSPSITDGVMYYACTDGYLYAFGTGLKYTYSESDFLADVGANELIVTSFDNGIAIAADTISFTVTQTGISLESSGILNLSASPSPFQSTATISFYLGEPGAVSLQVFDLTGRSIAFLVDQEMLQGEHSVQWNGCSANGRPVSAGLYLCRIESEGVVETIGLCLLR